MGGLDDTSPRVRGLRTSLEALNVTQTNRAWAAPLVYLAHNPLTYLGVFLVNVAVVTWLFVLPVMAQDAARHPYLLVIFVGVLPAAFLLGLGLMPLGVRLRYRHAAAHGLEPQAFAPLGWQNREFRHLGTFVIAVSGLNVIAGGYFSQQAVQYMDSPSFCAGSCHAMQPEAVAYADSPHQHVTCVACHIGAGGQAYMRAKLNGLRQVVAAVLASHPRPLPTPLHDLRPAREICESCHWPSQFSGVRIRVIEQFAEDSANTHTRTVLAIGVGGGPVAFGIHGSHVGPGITVTFGTDSSRHTVSWVRYADAGGTVREYAAPNRVDGAEGHEARTMDCLDCHTRPSHRFLSVARALDEALAVGQLDSTLPWIRRAGRVALQGAYTSSADAAQRIPWALIDLYRREYPAVFWPRRADVERAASGLAALHARNVFPEMGIEWETYLDNTGHAEGRGCFRCHGVGLRTPDGHTITGNCQACHQILALREAQPAILDRLGITRWRRNAEPTTLAADSASRSIYNYFDFRVAEPDRQ
jgi:hypothetical protein